jgi:hypothetical protein
MYAGCLFLESRKARDPAFAVTTGTISPIGQALHGQALWNWNDFRFAQPGEAGTRTKMTWDTRPNGMAEINRFSLDVT